MLGLWRQWIARVQMLQSGQAVLLLCDMTLTVTPELTMCELSLTSNETLLTITIKAVARVVAGKCRVSVIQRR